MSAPERPHGCACSESQEEYPTAGESPVDPERPVLTERWATGYAQDVRYFAKEHMDVRREASQVRSAYKNSDFTRNVLTERRATGSST